MIEFVSEWGYLAIVLLMLGENVFPPIPSELIMPMAGYHAAMGQRHVVLVILAGSLGSLLGAVAWYYVGRWVGARRLKRWSARHGRWMTLTPSDVDGARNWFDRHGGKAVLLGRLVPAVRTLISVPAGIAEMRLSRFLLYTAIGTVLWTAALAIAGYLLQQQHDVIRDYLNPITNVVVAGILIWYIYRLITFGRRDDAA
jgi:membrane protein DedA with SNARE-associated domain